MVRDTEDTTKGLFEPLKWCKLKSKWQKEKLVLSKFGRCVGLCYVCVNNGQV
jgi:hypothetical protein